MRMRILVALLLGGVLTAALQYRFPLVWAAPVDHDAGDDASPAPSLVTRVRDTGFLQISVDAFDDLSPNQKMDAYWLSMAAIAVNPISYDQNSIYGLREKHLLEAILTHPSGIAPNVLKKITEYTMLFWGNQGNHNAFNLGKSSLIFHPPN